MQAQDCSRRPGRTQRYIAPSQNLTLVDRDTIAMKTIGAMPRRDAATRPRAASRRPAGSPKNRWQGRLNYAANPEFVAPEGGILGNTNNKIVERPFPLHVSFSWGDTQRIQRWRRLMQIREVHTRESFIEAQLDTVSLHRARPAAADRRRSVVHRRGRARRARPNASARTRCSCWPTGTAR